MQDLRRSRRRVVSKCNNDRFDELEEMLEDKVNLKLWVKVRQDWQDNENYLGNIKSKI